MAQPEAKKARVAELDLVVKNVKVVRPYDTIPVRQLDLGIRGGKYVEIAEHIDVARAKDSIDAEGLLGFPGVCDPHMHVGIYAPLEEDAEQESRAAAMGGVTAMLSYIRTGQYYLDMGGPWEKFLPEVMRRSKGHYWSDYTYHVAPIEHSHIKEMRMAYEDYQISSFKIFMFYGGHGLHGASKGQQSFLMTDDKYDFGHFEFIMRELSAMAKDGADISLSLHCEIADILRAHTEKVQKEGKLEGLAAYSASRPQHSEGLAVFIASYLANETCLKNINLLHLTSRKALEAACQMKATFPHINFRREVTVSHLLLDIDSQCGGQPLHAKVNPPIRPREDVEFLWDKVKEGEVDWVCSDHACCSAEQKVSQARKFCVWSAKSGFGGTEWMLPGFFSEGTKRGLTPQRIAAMTSRHAAERFGLGSKGDIDIGKDADLVLLNPSENFVIRGKDSPSSAGYSALEGLEVSCRVKRTLLRGNTIFVDKGVGELEGAFPAGPIGEFLARPSKKA